MSPHATGPAAGDAEASADGGDTTAGRDAAAAKSSRPVETSMARRLDRALLGLLLLFAVCAPHSIAATQTAWLLAMILWVARLIVRPRPSLHRTPVDYALLAFFILSFVSALTSYDPDVSVGKLRAASLFTIVYVVAENVRTRREARLLAVALVASCVVSAFYTFGVYAVGRGVKVTGLSAESPLRAAGAREGDTLLEAEGASVESPADVERAVRDAAAAGRVTMRWPNGAPACVSTEREACVHGYRAEVPQALMVARAGLLEAGTPEARLGITSWTAGRDERAAGTYGHYTTYAEVLQLVASLGLGLLVALRRKRSIGGVLLAAAFAALVAALMMTVTRASALGLLLSAFAIVLAGASRRALFVTAAVALPLAAAGLLVLQQKRQVGFIDPKEGSTAWRLMVYREGLELLAASPRHLLVGVGMDSIKRHHREWGLFDEGRQNVSHFHSVPLQLAVERGLPALFAWLAVVLVYARTLWRLARSKADGRREGFKADGRREGFGDWFGRGLALGALGGLVGFLTSGLVHWNLGDSEVAMVFYFIMGLSLAVERFTREGETGRAGGDAAAAQEG